MEVAGILTEVALQSKPSEHHLSVRLTPHLSARNAQTGGGGCTVAGAYRHFPVLAHAGTTGLLLVASRAAPRRNDREQARKGWA